MGLDIAVYRARNRAVFKDDRWYDNENITEAWYSRKFWDLIHNMSFIKNIDDDCGEFIQLSHDNIEEMLQYASHHPDYWGEFNSVPALCKIYNDFENDAEDGWHYYFNYSY